MYHAAVKEIEQQAGCCLPHHRDRPLPRRGGDGGGGHCDAHCARRPARSRYLLKKNDGDGDGDGDGDALTCPYGGVVVVC